MIALSGCGKKGPPLPPFVRVPGAVSELTARRVGDDVVLSLTLPVQNVDQSTPINLGRVDVYAYTGRTAPPVARFTEVAQVVGKIEPTPESPAATTVRDTLAPDELVEGPPLARTTTPARNPSAPPDDSRAPLKRYYVAIAFSERGRPGPPSTVVEVPLTPLPDAPPRVRVTYDAEAVTLSWEPSGGLLGFLFDRVGWPSASPVGRWATSLGGWNVAGWADSLQRVSRDSATGRFRTGGEDRPGIATVTVDVDAYRRLQLHRSSVE